MVRVVRTQAEFHDAMRKAQPGDWIQIDAPDSLARDYGACYNSC